MNNQSIGKLGEQIAVSYLQKQGYKLVETNFYKHWGEIDIVAIDPKASGEKDVLVFVEVKTRMEYDFITPEESISNKKIRSLKKTAEFYNNSHPHLPELLRIDFVGIVLDSFQKPLKINLIKNITG